MVVGRLQRGSWLSQDEDEDGEDDDENGEAPKRGQKRLKRSRFVDDIAAVDDQDDDDEEEVINRPSDIWCPSRPPLMHALAVTVPLCTCAHHSQLQTALCLPDGGPACRPVLCKNDMECLNSK